MSNIKLKTENKEIIDAFNLGVNEGYVAYEDEKLVIKFAEWIVDKKITFHIETEFEKLYNWNDIIISMDEIYDQFIDSQDF